jgi:hypothetical protein
VGEILKTYPVRSAAGERPRSLRFLFDTGSLHTFVKLSAVRGMRNATRLAVPELFGGLGNGNFRATHLVDLKIRLLGVWCHQPAYVVPDAVLEKTYDVLAGAFFMQGYNIRLDPRRHDVILDPIAIQLSQRVR